MTSYQQLQQRLRVPIRLYLPLKLRTVVRFLLLSLWHLLALFGLVALLLTSWLLWQYHVSEPTIKQQLHQHMLQELLVGQIPPALHYSVNIPAGKTPQQVIEELNQYSAKLQLQLQSRQQWSSTTNQQQVIGYLSFNHSQQQLLSQHHPIFALHRPLIVVLHQDSQQQLYVSTLHLQKLIELIPAASLESRQAAYELHDLLVMLLNYAALPRPYEQLNDVLQDGDSSVITDD